MPAVNSIISQADYNSIRNKIVPILGTGSVTNGWGQTIRSSAVAEGNRVTINEYSNLRFDIINAWTHIYGSAPTTYPVIEGDTVKYNASNQPIDAYDSLVNTIVANKFTVAAGQFSTTTAATVTRTAAWSGSLTATVDVYWSNANAARYFFNSGGQIRFTASKSTGTLVNAQNTSWTSILSTAGTQDFGGNNPGTGTSPSDAQNWYRLTQSFQTWYSISGSSPYGSNTYRIQARCADVISNNNGTSAYAQFKLDFIDNYTDPVPANNPDGSANNILNYPPYDAVDGTLTISVGLLYASGVTVPSGTFTVTNPTVALSAITGS